MKTPRQWPGGEFRPPRPTVRRCNIVRSCSPGWPTWPPPRGRTFVGTDEPPTEAILRSSRRHEWSGSIATATRSRYAQSPERIWDRFRSIQAVEAVSLTTESHQSRGILADLGDSSTLDSTPERASAFAWNGPKPSGVPLDLRMDRRQKLTAKHLVNDLTERACRYRLAVRRGTWKPENYRRTSSGSPLTSTTELAEIVVRLHLGRWTIRRRRERSWRCIAVTELQGLDQFMRRSILSKWTRLVVITFRHLRTSDQTCPQVPIGHCVCSPNSSPGCSSVDVVSGSESIVDARRSARTGNWPKTRSA